MDKWTDARICAPLPLSEFADHTSRLLRKVRCLKGSTPRISPKSRRLKRANKELIKRLLLSALFDPNRARNPKEELACGHLYEMIYVFTVLFFTLS
ncbi:hypothetical protein CDAR_465521 [Caerostris darwini]|uniref:Uncharacterized protein n=1 Tax=Caerostris darwini TaxID=1538125 RepID=A0AAV4TKJ8_9ARAC|nr:hypothetical protein CDAR_465521 [Caerostris darwini]